MRSKNYTILLTEIITIFLMVFNILPREAAWFLTGILVFYFLFSPLEDSLWVFIASIPLFVALPITETFDSMSNWRLLLVILFLVWLKEMLGSRPPTFLYKRSGLPHRLIILTSIFLGLGVLSLLNAVNLFVGAKKLLYFINIFMLFFALKTVVRDEKSLLKIFRAVWIALGLALIVGYAQFIAVFFAPLYTFWQFWAGKVIPVFYGQGLGKLLSYSNTWFSYYDSQPPTLRMFSVFPDSHSFSLFLIIGLPFLLTMILSRPKEKRKLLFVGYLVLIIIFLTLIFSGSRGIWVSALTLLALLLIFILTSVFSRWRKRRVGAAPIKLEPLQLKIPQLIFGSLIIFFLLFPISSWFLLLSQKAQLKDSALSEDLFLVFERAKSITDLTEISARSRLEIWQRTIDSIAAHPILGVGLGNYPIILREDVSAAKRGASAHNLYFEIMSEMGIFALLVLLAMFWEVLKTALSIGGLPSVKSGGGQTSAVSVIWAGFFGLVFIWILIYSLFDVVLLNDKVFLFFIANLGLLYAAKSAHGFHQSPNL